MTSIRDMVTKRRALWLDGQDSSICKSAEFQEYDEKHTVFRTRIAKAVQERIRVLNGEVSASVAKGAKAFSSKDKYKGDATKRQNVRDVKPMGEDQVVDQLGGYKGNLQKWFDYNDMKRANLPQWAYGLYDVAKPGAIQLIKRLGMDRVMQILNDKSLMSNKGLSMQGATEMIDDPEAKKKGVLVSGETPKVPVVSTPHMNRIYGELYNYRNGKEYGTPVDYKGTAYLSMAPKYDDKGNVGGWHVYPKTDPENPRHGYRSIASDVAQHIILPTKGTLGFLTDPDYYRLMDQKHALAAQAHALKMLNAATPDIPALYNIVKAINGPSYAGTDEDRVHQAQLELMRAAHDTGGTFGVAMEGAHKPGETYRPAVFSRNHQLFNRKFLDAAGKQHTIGQALNNLYYSDIYKTMMSGDDNVNKANFLSTNLLDAASLFKVLAQERSGDTTSQGQQRQLLQQMTNLGIDAGALAGGQLQYDDIRNILGNAKYKPTNQLAATARDDLLRLYDLATELGYSPEDIINGNSVGLSQEEVPDYVKSILDKVRFSGELVPTRSVDEKKKSEVPKMSGEELLTATGLPERQKQTRGKNGTTQQTYGGASKFKAGGKGVNEERDKKGRKGKEGA